MWGGGYVGVSLPVYIVDGAAYEVHPIAQVHAPNRITHVACAIFVTHVAPSWVFTVVTLKYLIVLSLHFARCCDDRDLQPCQAGIYLRVLMATKRERER